MQAVRVLTFPLSPLVSEDVARAAVYMLNQPEKISIKALDVVPTGEPIPESRGLLLLLLQF